MVELAHIISPNFLFLLKYLNKENVFLNLSYIETYIFPFDGYYGNSIC